MEKPNSNVMMPLPQPKLSTLGFALATALILAACGTTQTTSTENSTATKSVPCALVPDIKYHGDTDSSDTIDQIRKNNAARDVACR